MKIYGNIMQAIGRTPLVRINHMTPQGGSEIWAKVEGMNPGGSVKDRIGSAMIEDAIAKGTLCPGGVIIEPTSGNTGIGLAMVAAAMGYRMILVMPDSMSIERRQMLASFGAELVLSPGSAGMRGAVDKACELVAQTPGAFMPQQFENPANPEAHRKTTGPEIIEALGGAPDGFVAGVGTGGTITGAGEVLRQANPAIHIAAIEPTTSPVLSGGKPGPNKIAGIGAGFVPGVLNTKIYDEVIQVDAEDAARVTRELALKEGLHCGISSGAAMWAAMKVSVKLGEGKRVVVILPDRGERYLSTGLFNLAGQ